MVIKINYTSSDIYVSTNVSPVYVVVNYSSVNNGGGVAWGAITGTLSDQTDLQNALDAKVPYTGAVSDVDLGEYELKAGQVEFDQTPTGAAGVGVMRWNDSDGTVDLGLKGGNVTLQVGQEQVLRVVNKTGADLLESQYRAVRIRLVSEGGSQGQRLAVVLAQGDNDPDSTTTIGIVTETIANNQEGFITTSGEVRGINTTGSLQGETWLDGDIIYLSPTVPGGITKVKPTAPDHMVVLGYVIYAHANNGKIFVKVDNGYELGELHDVYVPSPSNNDGIFWNTANSRYQNNSITGVLGYTPVPTTRTITINGTTLDLSADRTYTVSASATPAGSNTQIQYNNSGVFGASAGLVYDDASGILGILKNQNADTKLTITNGTSGTSSQTSLRFISDASSGASALTKLSTTTSGYKFFASKDLVLYNDTVGGNISIINDYASGSIQFGAGGSTSAHFIIASTGIGTFYNNYTISKNQNGQTLFSVSNTTSGTASNAALSLISDSSSGSFNAFKTSSTYTTYKTLIAKDAGFYNGTQGGDFSFLNDNTSGKMKWAMGGSSTAQMTLTAAGRLLLGTVSESTFLLDVNGTARVSNGLYLTNPYASSQYINLGTGTGNAIFYWSAYVLSIGGVKVAVENLIADPSGTSAGVNRANSSVDCRGYLVADSIGIGTTTNTINTSAITQINSTTKGFLPPRMTTTQKNAIGTPAAGLMVYDTTLNKLCVFTTAWETITSI